MRVELGLMSHPFHENPVWPDTAGIAAAARTVEALGFDGILVPEAGGHDPFFPLLLAAHETKRVTLRTGVAVAFPRSPMVMAQIAWDLQRFSHCRFELGLGTQVKGQNERRYAAPWTAPPGPRLREYILCMQAMFDTFQKGGPPHVFSGKHYQFNLMPHFFNPGPIEHPHVPRSFRMFHRNANARNHSGWEKSSRDGSRSTTTRPNPLRSRMGTAGSAPGPA